MDTTENFEDYDAKIVDTKKETDKKCPQCGGVMDFNPATGNLKCPFCDFEQKIENREKGTSAKKETTGHAKELDFNSAEFTANKDWGVNTKVVLCKSCGAESVYDALQTAAVCPFCGSNQVMDAKEQDTIAPGGVVPFQIDDKNASELFQNWIGKKFYCPKTAKDSARPDRFHGIYFPYWTFDTNTDTRYKGRYGIEETYKDSEGETHTKTDWHKTSGTYAKFIDDELVKASKNYDKYMLSNIEPFETEKNVTYKPEYIAGFVAERYSVGLKDAWEMAQKSIKSKLTSDIHEKIIMENHADTSDISQMDTIFSNITYKYLLLPVWISSFKYKDKEYHFMVNGQTGKVSGDTPLSIPKVLVTIIIILIIIYFIFIYQK